VDVIFCALHNDIALKIRRKSGRINHSQFNMPLKVLDEVDYCRILMRVPIPQLINRNSSFSGEPTLTRL